MDKAREVAFKVIFDIYESAAYANIRLAAELRATALSDNDRRLATELVYGVAKAGGTLDWIVRQYVDRPLKKIAPKIRAILRLGLYQLFFLDRIPPAAAVNEAVELAKKYGHKGTVGFVNAVLRTAVREPERAVFPTGKGLAIEELALSSMHPQWLVKRWVKQFGYEGAVKLCAADNEPVRLSVRTNTLKLSPPELMERLQKEGCKVEKSALTPEGIIILEHGALENIASLNEGLWQVQDESSMLVAHVLAPQPGEIVIDACSAPGGKTTHIAALMNNEGHIFAGDIHPHKLEIIDDNAKRLGMSIIEAVAWDATDIGEKYVGAAERVLVDAPCSGLGVLRRRPDSRWRKKPEEISKLPQLQSEILRSAAKCVKPGGVLVYSTCTTEPVENDLVVEAFLAEHADFFLDNTGEYLPVKKSQEKMVHLYPHIDGTDGFFIARLGRKKM